MTEDEMYAALAERRVQMITAMATLPMYDVLEVVEHGLKSRGADLTDEDARALIGAIEEWISV